MTRFLKLQFWAYGSIAALALVGTGCDTGPERIPVTGRVLYQGEPLKFGSVMIQPLGGGDIARASISDDGTFELRTRTEGDGVVPATYRVRVTCFEGQRQAIDSGNREPSLGRLLIPKKFTNFGTSGLTMEVAPGMTLPVTLELE